MNAKNKLLDKAAERCSPANYVGLALRLGVTTSLVSAWKLNRYPMPAERIAEVARIAQVDSGEWMLLVESEQAKGEARKAYSSLVKRLGIAALLALWSVPGMASTSYNLPVLPIMSVRKSLARFLAWCRFTNRSEHHADLLPLQS